MTEETKHTPGPWVYATGPALTGRYHAVHAADEYMVCECWDGEDEARNEADARLIAAAPELLGALERLLDRDEINTCQHEETYRGGVLWEICSSCGAEWADDEGGKPEWIDPPEWIAARAAIAKAKGKP